MAVVANLLSEEGRGKDGAWARLRFVKMAVQLLHEQSLGRASPLAAYIGALPRGAALDTPLQWRPEEVAALRYPHLQAEVSAQGSCSLWCYNHDMG